MASVRVGDVKVSRVQELSLPGMTPEDWYLEYNDAEWQANKHLCSTSDLDPTTNALISCVQSWVLELDGRSIVIDTGLGDDKSRPALGPQVDHKHGDYLELLTHANVDPEAVDLVVSTHLHLDHVGWNTRLVNGDWVPTFPNAKYVMPAADLEFWNPDNDGKVSRKGEAIMENVYSDSIAPILEAGLAQPWEGEYVIDGTLRLEPAPGHTPGNAVVKLESKGERAVFIGDLLHSPVQVGLPHWNSCLCEDPSASQRSRFATLGWAADNAALVFAGHFGEDKAAEVARSGSAFALKGWRGFSEGDA